MNFQSKFIRMSLLSLAFVLMSFSVSYAQDSEYSFKVYNKTQLKNYLLLSRVINTNILISARA